MVFWVFFLESATSNSPNGKKKLRVYSYKAARPTLAPDINQYELAFWGKPNYAPILPIGYQRLRPNIPVYNDTFYRISRFLTQSRRWTFYFYHKKTFIYNKQVWRPAPSLAKLCILSPWFMHRLAYYHLAWRVGPNCHTDPNTPYKTKGFWGASKPSTGLRLKK